MSVVALYKNRIIGYGMVAPDQLLANPLNFRVHTKEQKDKMRASLRTLGWMDTIIVNQRSQFILNGHMRVQIALEDGEPEVPVSFVDFDEDEEKVALATFDAIAALAGIDRDLLDDLLEQAHSEDQVMNDFLNSMKPGSLPVGDEPLGNDYDARDEDLGDERWLILVTCTTEEDQVELLGRFEEEGLLCRALTTT